MNNMDLYHLINTIGWTLIHSLWQALAFGAIIWVLLRFISRDNARLRYIIAGSGLLAIFMTSCITFIRYLGKIPTTAEGTALSPEALLYLLNNEQTAEKIWSIKDINIETYFPILVNIWCIGAGLLALHMLISYSRSIKLKNYMAYPLRKEVMDMATQLSNKLGIKQKIQFKESGYIGTPSLIGYFKPVILLPVSLLSGIPKNQLEIIIAHELAHIHRHDYLIQFIQGILELLFFYHPVVWWLSSVVKTEREHICDDLAVKVCGESLTLIKALNNMEAIRKKQNEMVLGFSGKKSGILYRVQRILKTNNRSVSSFEKFMISGLFIFLLSALLLVSNFAISGNGSTGNQFFSKINVIDIDEKKQFERQVAIPNQDIPEKEPKLKVKPVAKVPATAQIEAIQSDTTLSKKEIKERVEEIIKMQKAELKAQLKEISESKIEIEDIKVDLKEALREMEFNKHEMEKEMQEHRQELERELANEDFMKEFEIEIKEQALELEESLKDIREDDFYSDERKKEMQAQIKEKMKEFNSAEFKEKMQKQFKIQKEAIRKELERMNSSDWKLDMKIQEEAIRKELEKMKSGEMEKELKESLEKAKNALQENLEKIDTKEYRKQLEERIEKNKNLPQAPYVRIDKKPMLYASVAPVVESESSSPYVYMTTSGVSKSPYYTDSIRYMKRNMEMQMISGNKAPLVVIDGIKRSGTSLEDIDPNNIKSIKVLKDAAATSIYGQEGKNGVLLIEMKIPGDNKPLIVVDGIIKVNEDLHSIDPANIKSMVVLKSDNAVVKYGTAAKDGVVEITTKDAPKYSISISDKTGKKDPLYIIDGKINTDKKIQDIVPEKIESIHVLKGNQAIDKYGKKANNGAIEITLKDESENVTITGQKFSMKMSDKPGKKDPVYVVDGKIISHRKMKKISSNDIKSISVIKGEQAIEKYGPKAKNGAIEILLKN